MVASLVNLPDDILYNIYEYLEISDLKNLASTNSVFKLGVYDRLYRYSKYVITFDDATDDTRESSANGQEQRDLEDLEDDEDDEEYILSDDDDDDELDVEDDDDDDNNDFDDADEEDPSDLEMYFDDFDVYFDGYFADVLWNELEDDEDADYEYESDFEYDQQFQFDNVLNEDEDGDESEEDIDNGQDEIVIIRNSARWFPPSNYCCGRKVTTKNPPEGLPIEFVSNDERLIAHIKQFKYFNINMSINSFNEIIDRLNKYEDLLKKLFSNDEGNKTKKEIKIFIKLNYTFQSFNDVKDCLTNVNRLIYYFDPSKQEEGGDNVLAASSSVVKSKAEADTRKETETKTGTGAVQSLHNHNHRLKDLEDNYYPKEMVNKIQIDLAINHYNSSAYKW
ncbi:uncharacterized protein RJT21DRAFT_33545 [Scheffersomyces amazonensis]|uniref:uncharacterized protein n=1 Tax=Scheffersomyces amazonensis TaxID=1078765 RepID=UPI00315DC872